MKKRCILFCFLLFSFHGFSQQHSEGTLQNYDPGHTECLSDSFRQVIKAEINSTILSLRNQNIIPPHYSSTPVQFDWPLRLRPGLVDYGYHSISGGVDHNPAYPNQLLDYNCGALTYDTPSGYNHAGTDFFLWPFDWNKMDSGDVEIVAAAAGTITYKSDGNFDRSCGTNNNYWNSVTVQHADGSEVWYGHMKKFSLTTKNVGQTVAMGEYLGKVGSSGNSTGPHLHLEVYDSLFNLIDPFQGACNSFNSNSWWISQRPYIDAGINHTATNFKPPQWQNCPLEHIKNERDYYTNTDTIYLINYMRFLSTGDSSTITIYRPDNSVWGNWVWNTTWPNYTAAWVYWWMIPGASEPSGQWKFETIYKNQTYFHYFWLGPAGIQNASTSLNMTSVVYPNPTTGEFTIGLVDQTINFSNEKVELKITDVLGNIILEKILTNNKTEIKLPEISSGTYFYVISNAETKIAIGKFTVK